eukprot:c12105_g1_i1.p2 GENE.c12105_g1_i1~~c12105_g1_i1.p2  ORF type:complete len:198 (+),score=59.05 c12105_g1_i1:44-595(+)
MTAFPTNTLTPEQQVQHINKLKELMDRKVQLQQKKIANPVAHAQQVAQQIAMSLAQRTGTTPMPVGVMTPTATLNPAVPAGSEKGHFLEEVEINDYPQQARWKVTKRGALGELVDRYSVSITTRGVYVGTGKQCPPGERKLYLAIEGAEEAMVKQAKREIKQSLDESALGLGPPAAGGRYNVV